MEFAALGQKVVRFGIFEADLRQRLLTKGGLRVRLQDQPFQLLAVLLERPGDLVTREELQQKLWPADTYVAFDDGLNTAIKKLRSALGDTADNPRFIETVPRRGYRFIAPATFVDSAPAAPEPNSTDTTENLVIAAQERSRVVIEPNPSVLSGGRLLIAIACLATLGAAGYFYQTRHRGIGDTGAPGTVAAPNSIRMRPSVAVMGFRNLSPGSEDIWLSTAISEMLNTELAAGERLRMIPGEQISRGKTDLSIADTEALGKDTLSRVRAGLGADFVVLGSYTALGQRLKRRVRLDLRVQDTGAGETITEESVTGNEDDLFELVSEAGLRLRQKLDIAALNHEEAVRVRASLPANVEAARLYAEGLTKLRTFDALQASALLAKAAEADPKSAMIHAALASAWTRLGYDAKSKAEAKRALELASVLSREDLIAVEARYRETAREWPAAIEAYRNLWNLFPDNLDYGLQLASVQVSAGLGKDALATVIAMRKVPHQGNEDPRIDLAEAAAHEVVGEFRNTVAAAATAAKIAEMQQSHVVAAKALSEEGWALERLGEFDKAKEALQNSESAFSAAGDRVSAAMARSMLGELLQDHGDLEGARKAYEETIATCRAIGNLKCVGRTTNALGNLKRDQNDLAGARKCFEQVLSINRETGYPAGIAVALGNLANVLDDMGNLPESQKMQEQALDIFNEMEDKRGRATTMTNLANVLVEQGRLDQALSLVERAAAIHRETGFQRGLSFALSSRADILELQDSLTEAREAQSEALAIRKKLGTPEFLASSLMQSASLSLDQSLPAQAQSAAQEAAKQIENLKAYDLEASAYALLAKSLLAQGNVSGAKQAAEHAVSSANKVIAHPPRMDAALALAAVDAASGQTAAARTKLSSVLAESSKYGYAAYRFEAELALAELDLKSGRAAEGRGELAALQKEASAQGCKLAARKAAAAK